MVIAGSVSVRASFVYVTLHATSEAGFADWATASRVLVSCTTGEALGFMRFGSTEKGRSTNDLVGTVLGFMVTFLATVSADKSGLGINFAGIVEITSNTDLSNFHFLD